MNSKDDNHPHKPSSIALQEYQEEIFEFLRVFCNYDIKTPLNLVLGFADVLLLDDSLSPEKKEDIAFIKYNSEGILKTIDSILQIISFEQEQSKPSEHFQPEEVRLRPILEDCISQAEARIEYSNKLRARLSESEKSGGPIIVTQARDPIKLTTNIPDDLPPVSASPYILSEILNDLAWFIISPHLKTEINFSASSDHESVFVSMEYIGFDVDKHLPGMVEQFENAIMPFKLSTFGITGRLLYVCWYRLREFNGNMDIFIQEGLEGGGDWSKLDLPSQSGRDVLFTVGNMSQSRPSKITVTISLPIYENK